MDARNNSVDEGVIAFGRRACNIDIVTLRITLRQLSGGSAILHNNTVMSDVTVEIAGSIPLCLHCTSNHCVHVGSAVCASRMAKSGDLITE